MLKKLLFLVLTAAASALNASAFDFDGGSAQISLEDSFYAAAAPAAGAPENKTPGCRPFLLSLSVGGVDETVIIERLCTPESEPIWALKIELTGNRSVSARISSDKYPDQRRLIEKRIGLMALEGMTVTDADVIVNKAGPRLKLAAGAETPREREAALLSAIEILREHLTRP